MSSATFRDAIVSGANNLTNNKDLIDQMNIFPVPDGDTGTNMSLTINSAMGQIPDVDFSSVGDISSRVSSCLLRAARGNSGAILSLIFKGMASGLEGAECANAQLLLNGLSFGVKNSYGAVMKPTEGTMLTVVRVAYEKGRDFLDTHKNVSVSEFWTRVCQGAKEALEMSPELLPILKKVGVVDAGGKGLCLIFEGMLSVFKEGKIIKISSENRKIFQGKKADKDPEISPLKNDSLLDFTNDLEGEITFTYCTEFIVQKNIQKEEEITVKFRNFLESIGDCVVVVTDSEIVKVHVHTNDPGHALQEALGIGQLLTVKIENMREQSRLLREKATMGNIQSDEGTAKVDPVGEIGFVAICNGIGVKNLFRDLGCDNVVTGGQSMNPSTNDIVRAVLATPAKTVFVLPNNKNILICANQAVSLVEDRRIVVIESKTIPQGLSAMLAYDADASAEENLKIMSESIKNVKTGQITFASRNAEFGGIKIKKGDIMALSDGKLVFKSKNSVRAAIKLVLSMLTSSTSFITIIYGENITKSQAERVMKKVSSKVGNRADVSLVNGGQSIYHFIFSVE
ncbi:MAG: DAK2 domain-containing protein [Oscillospiraceae bacterium]|nr:DAK2 domain-containing protein [Oscillospiraceae bacterium]